MRCHIERQIAENAHATRSGVLTKAAPLHEEGELLALDTLQLPGEIASRSLQGSGISSPYISRPRPPRRAGVRGAQDLKQGVVIQPWPGFMDKRGVRLRVLARQLGGIEESRVAGIIGAHPIGRAVRPRRARG